MDSETRKLLDQLNSAFSEFKEQNDKRLKEIETKGSADAVTVAAVDKANTAISELSAKVADVQRKAKEQEIAIARHAELTADPKSAERREKERAYAAQFLALTRREPVAIDDVTDADVEAYRAYAKAFDAYARRGNATPADMKAALSVGSDPDGGFWVPPDKTGRIVQLVYETSPMRQVASVQSIGTDKLEGVLDLDEAASGGWVSETGARPESATPQIGRWEIPVHEQYANPKTTQKLLDDAMVDVGAWLEKKIAEKLARVENKAFIDADGAGKPRGFLTYTAGVPTKSAWGKIEQVNSGASGAFAATDPGDKLIDFVFKLKAAYRAGAVWLMARSTVAAARKLKDGQGNYLWQPDFTSLQGSRLLGFPITEAEDMPAIAANSLSIAFGNFKEGYQIVDRIGIRVLRDPYTGKPYVQFYTTKRVGGDVVNTEAIKIMKFAA